MSQDISKSPTLEVRAMNRDDMVTVHRLIHELAKFEGVPDGPQLSVQDLIEDGFECFSPWFFGLVACRGERIVGYALCNRAYSSWTRRAFYLEDLFVLPEERRNGVATIMIQELCKMAVREGVHRVDWHVLEDNEMALRFYGKLGAVDMRRSEGRAALRLHRDRIEAVARGDLL
ncbi:hypothetical protein KGM_211444 [Danaus plexippus plexippus]|uniref:Uncharacterized protein n=1 Tax=Danaus plexippus plexippus TaxID=278856 RepID=A0A212EQ20_DANPL|nr:hypothetical protein KGM_211444 [Danaus plexippus plexippus]